MMRMVGFCIAASLALSACGEEPASAQARGMSASDRRLGAQEHPKLLQQFGGAYTGPGTAMVQRVGREMAVRSGLVSNGGECTVTLLNTTVVNAFAIPGCYVYVTRGLLAIMNDEDELASVLGHEIGHVAARHSQKRQNAALGAGIASILGAVLTGSSAIGQLVGQGGQLLTLGYSRSQEHEADDLGIRYMTAGGFDPFASPDMLQTLEDQSALETRLRGRDEAAQVPGWARTHPLTEDRVRRATAQASKTGLKPGARARKRDAYLAAVDGLLYGDDPSQGYVDGNRFAHPTLKIAFEAPQGYYLSNSSDAVTATGPGEVQIQFSGGRIPNGAGLGDYVETVFRGVLGQSAARAQYSQLRAQTINGWRAADATARVPTRGGTVDATVVAYDAGSGNAYHFLFIKPAGYADNGVADRVARSFRRLSDTEAAQLRPRTIEVVTVKPGETLQTMASRMAYSDAPLERFLVLNDRDRNQPLRPGERVKLVRYAR